MKKLEATLMMMKPDICERNLVEILYEHLGLCGLNIIATTIIKADLSFIKSFYNWPSIFHPDLIEAYLCSVPMQVIVVVGENAVADALRLKKKFRNEFQLPNDQLHNLVHCSDSSDVFSHEFSTVTQISSFTYIKPAQDGRVSQVQVIPYTDSPNGARVLLMRRSITRGGFWQVVTGGVRPKEDIMLAGFREMYEETKLFPKELYGPIYEHDFTESTGTLHETVFVARLSDYYTPILSHEHTEYMWVNPSAAIRILKWPSNKEAMKAFLSHTRPK